MSNFKAFMNNFFFISSVAIGSIYVVKAVINTKRDETYIPEYVAGAEGASNNKSNIAKIKPGFAESTGEYERKSEYEGAGLSYLSRKKGDRLTTWSFFKNKVDEFQNGDSDAKK